MHPSVRIGAATVLASLLAACGGGLEPPGAPAVAPVSSAASHVSRAQREIVRGCAEKPKPGYARCDVLIRHDLTAHRRKIHPRPDVGYYPSSFQNAYDLPSSTAGSGQTVAIVDAYDDPKAASDLSVYRSYWGLSACTAANGCFKKVSQTGSATKLPAENPGWDTEISLDLDTVSAVCPNCKILLVEATTNSNANLEAAENEAAALGAHIISNSYSGAESQASSSYYAHPGVVITASAGDDGYVAGVGQPCSFATVVCVGGTSLQAAGNARGYTESVWNDGSGSATGSGCSAYVPKPSWQNDAGCTMRSETDVSFDADPDTGIWIYDSVSYDGYSGWQVYGGTSEASPAIAAVYALAGNASSLGEYAASWLWEYGGYGLNAVTSGNNLTDGATCPSAYPYICTAGTNADGTYSGPAGWGTPNGTTDF